MEAAAEIADFAALLRELKERSGLSYESLAKRAHMSTTTLHRYCKGEGVPADDAAVARFARVCKATPEELKELHRRWALAHSAWERHRRSVAAGRGAGASMSASASEPRSTQARTGEVQPETVPDDPSPLAPRDPAVLVAEPSRETVVSANGTPARIRTARTRWALIAAGTAAVIAGIAVFTAITATPQEKEPVTAPSGPSASATASSRQEPSASPTTHPPTSAPASPFVR
ncbi:helix-turn-helix domain-containing protein [Streptomyces sp. NPDC008159]|uniref:helix-turn-helix domain-containing protein n=1 Tax=Streptomyces sp. NPDC008159 TaxID=3364817 RepID=UPI0036ECB2B6